MMVKHLCQILLLVFVCVASADHDVGVNENEDEIKLEIENIENVFHLAAKCSTDANCHHLGKCEGTLCKCKKGTSGDFCERVDECVDNPVRCGTRNDVSCVFDVLQEKADCKCGNDSKTYVTDEERCMSPCTSHDQCGQYGSCYHAIGDHKFCACELGVSGDYCEIIDECENKDVDCGHEPNAICTLGDDGRAYCKCLDLQKAFDYDEKVCKDCKCGPSAKGCKFEKGSKICQCSEGFKQNGYFCEKCDCGSEGSLCEFKEGKKLCTCKDGYIKVGLSETCRQMCNATNPCENGGKCERKLCNCLKGTSGHLCKTIDDCQGRDKCGEADCLYNMTSSEAYCKCSQRKLGFDDVRKVCRSCDCGGFERSCSYVQGKKKCDCEGVYEDKLGVCTPCYCRGYSSMYGCYFDDRGQMICKCIKGYAQQGDECKKCDCGDHGKCRLSGWYSKTCICDEGYVESNGMCVECSCGKNGRCHIKYGEKVCSCEDGYKEYEGICKACSCGYDAECKFNRYGEPECTCIPGTAMKQGRCVDCDCHPGDSCVFNENNLYEDKTCICPSGYANSQGSCKACNCGVEKANCTILYTIRTCICPKGYEEKKTMFLDSTCKDIDECLKSDACPLTTNCVNTPGSYECDCKEGYKEPNKWIDYDIKVDGCEDIDECTNLWSGDPCIDIHARCVNTIGSYRCDCPNGFRVVKGYKESANMCIKDIEARPWRIATIVVGVISAITIIALLIGICNKHMSLSDC